MMTSLRAACLRLAAPAVLLAALAAAFPTLQNVAYAQASPSVAVNLNSPGSVTEGAPIAVTMSFGNLAFDSDRSTIDYTFRADVVGADECEGNRVGVTRYIYQVDENPEVREGAISASCPTGDYAVQASISSPDNVELASASAAFSVAAPDDQPEFSATVISLIEEAPLVTAQANAGSEGSSIGLGWGAVSGATHYVIERSSKGPYREWTVDTRTFTDTEILGDHVYTYFVRAKNASGLGPRSRPVIVRSLVQGNITPKAPDGLRASEATAGRVVLNWTQFQRVNTAAGLRISGFRIRRQNLDDGSDLMCGRNPDGAQAQADYWYCHNRQFVLAASCCGERGTSYTDSTVRPDTQYRYWIQAINTNGVGDRSDPVLIRTKRTAATPLAPGLLNPWESSNARGTVNLKWSASASTVGITNYVLQRKLAGAAWVTLNISGWAFETSVQGDHQYVEWQDTGVSANSAYSYRVAAINSAGQGEWSDELSIETEGIAGSPARPRMFKAHRHASDPSILVATWEAVPTASTYVLKVYDVHDNNRLFLNQTTTDGSTSYEVRSVAPNTAYVFKLHATNSANLNGAAATAHVTSAAALGTPVVGSLAVDVYTGGQVQPGFRMYDFKWEPFEGCRHRYRIQYYDTVNAMQSNWSWKHFYDLNTHFPPSQRRVTKVSNASPHERASLGGVIFRVACINQVNANYWEAHGVVAEAAVDIPSASADSAMATAAPPILTAVGGNGEVVLTWDAPENDGGAEITDYEYRINRSGPWIPIGSTDTTYTVTGLVNGTSYVFEVRAVNAAGRSASTNRAEATPELFTLDFAHFANGDGITSDLVFVNVGTHPIRPLLYFYDQEGQPMAAESVVDITGDLEIQEDGSLSIQTEMEPLGELTISTHGQGELVSGSVKVDAGGPIGGVLRFNLPDIGVAGVGPSTPVRDVVFPVRRQEGGINTGVAIHNLESSAEIVRCELMREGVLHDAVSIPLAANGQSSWFINEVFTGADTSDFAGSVHCDAAGPGIFAAVALELDAASRIFTTLPVFPTRRAGGRSAELTFAHFANGDGTTSDLVFVNLSTERSRPAPTPFHSDILPVRPALYFYDTEGEPLAAESVVDVTGDLAVTGDGGLTVQTEMEPLGVLTISTHGRGELVSGSVRVIADEPIGGVLRFDLPGIGVAGVGVSSPVRDALFPVRRQEGGINTGVAVHNLGEDAMEVTCELMQGGTVLDDVSIPLAANGQSSWFIDEVFTGADTSDFAGSVRCTAPGEGMFTGVAVELDATNRIFTTLPVVPVPERMSQE